MHVQYFYDGRIDAPIPTTLIPNKNDTERSQ